MLFKGLILSLSLFGAGIGNFGIINHKDIPKMSTRAITGDNNKCHEIRKTTKTRDYINIKSFTVTTRSYESNGGIFTITFSESDFSQALDFYFYAYNENGDRLARYVKTYDRYETYGETFKFKLWHEDFYKPGNIRFVFKWDYRYYSGGSGTFADFSLNFGGGELKAPNYEIKLPYEASVYPNEGYSEISGDYVKIKNLDEVIKIEKFGKFLFNDLGLEFYMEPMGDTMYVRGFPMLEFKLSDKIKGLSLEGEVYDSMENYNHNLFDLDLLDTDDGNTKEIKNVINYYYQDSHYYFSKRRKDGYQQTQDYYFPKVLYEPLKEIDVTLSFNGFTKNSSGIYCRFKLLFLNPAVETSFKIVGEIENEIVDDELKEIDL